MNPSAKSPSAVPIAVFSAPKRSPTVDQSMLEIAVPILLVMLEKLSLLNTHVMAATDATRAGATAAAATAKPAARLSADNAVLSAVANDAPAVDQSMPVIAVVIEVRNPDIESV